MVPPRHQRRKRGDEGPWDSALSDCEARIGTGMLVALIGIRGTGKTQIGVDLIRGVCEAEAEKPKRQGSYDTPAPEGGWRRETPARYVKAISLFVELRSAFRDGGPGEEAAIAPFCAVPLLVIDEIHERGNTAWEDRMLVHIVDRRYDAMLDTVLIGNVAPDQLQAQLGDSIVSRIQECGRVITCDWPSFRAKGLVRPA